MKTPSTVTRQNAETRNQMVPYGVKAEKLILIKLHYHSEAGAQ